MSTFPLYDTLCSQVTQATCSSDLSFSQKTELASNINSLDIKGKELVYALIMFFYIKEDNGSVSDESASGKISLPYKNDSSTELVWSVTNLPLKLKHILYIFTRMHIEQMKHNVSQIETEKKYTPKDKVTPSSSVVSEKVSETKKGRPRKVQ